ncbi:hypothetical protein ACCS93_36480 [Rhizobium ruizarguesonis]
MLQSVSSCEKLEIAVISLSDHDHVDLPLVETSDRLACQRIRPAQRRRLYHFRRASRDMLLKRRYENATILRDAEGHVRALLDGGVARYVSTSASGAICAIAISQNPVGIDIERADGHIDLVPLLDFVAAPCAAALKSLPPDIAAFEARIAWTRLEAGLKQTGRGIHDYIVQGPARIAERKSNILVLATFDWVCAVTHGGDAVEVTSQIIDFKALCDA